MAFFLSSYSPSLHSFDSFVPSSSPSSLLVHNSASLEFRTNEIRLLDQDSFFFFLFLPRVKKDFNFRRDRIRHATTTLKMGCEL